MHYSTAGTRQTSRSGGSGGGRTSGSGEPVGSAPVNVFQDHERAAGLSSTKAELFKKLDALVYPGRPAKEKTDNTAVLLGSSACLPCEQRQV